MWSVALTLAMQLCKGELLPPLHFPPRVPPPLVLPSQLAALDVIYSREGKRESEGHRMRVRSKTKEPRKERQTLKHREAIPASPRCCPAALEINTQEYRGAFSGFKPQSKSLTSLQCQTQAELLTPPTLGPPVSSRIQAGTKGRYQASQPAHHSASGPGPTVVTRTWNPTPISSRWPEASIGPQMAVINSLTYEVL